MATKKKKTVLEDCGCDNTNVIPASVNGPDNPTGLVPTSQVGNASAWGEVPLTLDSTSDCPVTIEFVQHFNTYIQLASGSTGWYLGYLDESVFSTALNSLTNTQITSNYNDIPTVNGGTIGYTNTITGTEGYYKGSTGSHEFEIYRYVVVHNGTKAIVIKVLELNSTEVVTGYWVSNIVLEFKCFDVAIPTPSLDKETENLVQKFIKKGKRA